MSRFDTTHTFVSGGAQGIGAAIARGVVAEGGHVTITDVLEDEGRDLSAQLGDAATFVKLDVTNEDAWAAAVEAAEAFAGPVTTWPTTPASWASARSPRWRPPSSAA